MHLRRSRIRKGTVRYPVGVGRNALLPPALCALHRGGALGLLWLHHPEPTGGGRRGRGCEVTTCDCQQQRRG